MRETIPDPYYPAPPADGHEPLLDVWAKVGVRLESLTEELHAQRVRQASAFEDVSYRPVQPVSFLGSAAPFVMPVFCPAGWTWAVQAVAANGLGSGSTTSTASEGTGTITAGAGSATLASGVPTTGFTLSFSAAPSTAGTATLSNVSGGPLVFNIPSGQTSPYTVTFPAPIAASGTPTLTIAGLGTGAGTAIIYGLSTTTVAADSMIVYRGVAASSAVPQNEMGILNAAVPLLDRGRTGLLLKAQQSLVFGGTLTAGTLYTVNVDMIEVSDRALPEFLM